MSLVACRVTRGSRRTGVCLLSPARDRVAELDEDVVEGAGAFADALLDYGARVLEVARFLEEAQEFLEVREALLE